MNIKIFGSGMIESGEYDDIIVYGSSKINGSVRCLNMNISGSVHCGGSIESLKKIDIAGSATFEETVIANDLEISGSVSLKKNCQIKNTLCTSGSMRSNGNIKAQEMKTSGVTIIDGGIESEKIDISGVFQCQGLVNAEQVKIEVKEGLCVNEIGGGTIHITSEEEKLKFTSKLYTKSQKRANTVNSIEGDTIVIEGVQVHKIVGRIVSIGRNCQVGIVQYSEEIEIDDSAVVDKYEKI